MTDHDKPSIMETIMRDQERKFVMNNIAKSAPGETQGGRPRICEVLGVEVNEEWRVTGNDMATYRINEDGEFEYAMPLYSRPGHGKWMDGDLAHLLDFINHPDRILHKPRFTEDEVADAKAIARIYRSAVVGRLENGKPYTSNRVMSLMEAWSDNDRITYLPERLFPSLRPGQSVALADICGC